MLANACVDDIDVLGLGPCEVKFKETLQHILRKVLLENRNKHAHLKEVQKRLREFSEDPGSILKEALGGGGKKSPKWPIRERHATVIWTKLMNTRHVQQQPKL